MHGGKDGIKGIFGLGQKTYSTRSWNCLLPTVISIRDGSVSVNDVKEGLLSKGGLCMQPLAMRNGGATRDIIRRRKCLLPDCYSGF